MGGDGGMIRPLVLCRGLLPWTFCLPSIYCEKVLWAIHPKDSGYIQEGPGERLWLPFSHTGGPVGREAGSPTCEA